MQHTPGGAVSRLLEQPRATNTPPTASGSRRLKQSGQYDRRKPVKSCTIPEAIEEIRAGRMIILVDNEDRENEGDLVIAAEFCTPEAINFMATHGRGLICAPMTQGRARELELDLMVENNQDKFGTAFTVSVDAREGTTTGISAHDRARTVRVLIDERHEARGPQETGAYFPAGGAQRRRPGPRRAYRGRR